MDFSAQCCCFIDDVRVNSTEIPDLITKFLTITAILNINLLIRVDYILDFLRELEFYVTFALDLPVFFIGNRQELVDKTTRLQSLASINASQKSVIHLYSSVDFFFLTLCFFNFGQGRNQHVWILLAQNLPQQIEILIFSFDLMFLLQARYFTADLELDVVFAEDAWFDDL